MRFVDEVTIQVAAGSGGDGCLSFRREKFVPRGGPDGGSGGKGGSVYVVGKCSLATLADLEYHHRYVAQDGANGRGKNMTGADGADCHVPVPLGTDVWDAEKDYLIGEVLADGAMLLVAQGGRGGRGNAAFKTQRNPTPRLRELGKPGQARRLRLALRMISDIGLVGLPNAGKSSILARITHALPKIADYPFTTLAPNLGTLDDGVRRYTIADLPGIVEGASQGKGLGLRFLRHIERTRVLVFVIDSSRPAPDQDYRLLWTEIRNYNPAILKKPQLLVINKIDLLPNGQAESGILSSIRKQTRVRQAFAVSALTGQGIDRFAAELFELLSQPGLTAN
ncbi:MAG: GTPase ObgE [candidate division WOR-3 bacterium]